VVSDLISRQDITKFSPGGQDARSNLNPAISLDHPSVGPWHPCPPTVEPLPKRILASESDFIFQNLTLAPVELAVKRQRRLDSLTILETISEGIDHIKAIRIAEHLQAYFDSQDNHITGLRISLVETLSPMIEWREGKDVDVLAFCKVPDGQGPCSLLMHIGEGIRQPTIRRWDRASIKWSVADIGDLKELLRGAQDILGVLQWSEDDLKRSCLENCKDCTPEEYSIFHTG